VDASRRGLEERNLLVGIDLDALLLEIAAAAPDSNAGHLLLAALLNLRQAARLVELALTRLALGLLAERIGEAGARLGQHLLLVLVHVDRIGPRRLRLGRRIDFAGPQAPRIVAGRQLPLLRGVEQTLVVLEALLSPCGPPAARWSATGTASVSPGAKVFLPAKKMNE
jgi:hypothetical protein